MITLIQRDRSSRHRAGNEAKRRTSISSSGACRFALLALVLVLASCAHRPSVDPSLAAFIDAEIARPPFTNALWGIRVEEANGEVLAERNSRVLMMPGSNRKIFVSAFAAECLGPAGTLSTDLWLDGAIEAGVLKGDLIVRGGGDPTLGGRYEADRDIRLLPLLEALRSRGITRIEGSVIADVSLFSRELIPGSWKTDNLGATYAAPVDAITFNENVVGVTLLGGCDWPSVQTDPPFVEGSANLDCGPADALLVDSDRENDIAVTGIAANERKTSTEVVAIETPALYAAQAFSDFLERMGIEVTGPPRWNGQPRAWREQIASIPSPPVYELLAVVLKNSQNLYSEMLFRIAAGGPIPIDYESAYARERDFLTTVVGVPGSEFAFADGCGLSVENMVTPAAIVKTFRYFWEPPRRELFRALLATPGESGTLRRRLAGLETTMRGKTGTIDGVSALSGYVIRPDGQPRFFSLIVNHHTSDSDQAEAVLDRIVQRLAE